MWKAQIQERFTSFWIDGHQDYIILQRLQIIVSALGYLSELDVKTLSLNTSYIWVIKMEILNWYSLGSFIPTG